MAQKSRATAAVCVGTQKIMVRLYAVTDREQTRAFHLLHLGCGSRLKQQYVCISDGAVVDTESRARAYEYSKGQHVVFTPAELEELEQIDDGEIELVEYIPPSAVDPVYFDRADYLAPDDEDGEPYRVLAAALAATKRAAVGQYTSRGRQRLVLLRVTPGRILIMHHLYYADDVRTPPPLAVGDPLRSKDLDKATQAIRRRSSDRFTPSKYVDAAKRRLQEAAVRKAEGGAAEPMREEAADDAP